MLTTEPRSRRLSCAETAKLVRQALKTSFPAVTFSIRSKTYSGGASIRVEWLDGPTVPQVEAITDRFEGAEFDGMEDLKRYKADSVINGERVSFAADYIFEQRDYTTAAVEQIKAAIKSKYGIEWDLDTPFDLPGYDRRVWGNEIFYRESQNLELPIAPKDAKRHTF